MGSAESGGYSQPRLRQIHEVCMVIISSSADVTDQKSPGEQSPGLLTATAHVVWESPLPVTLDGFYRLPSRRAVPTPMWEHIQQRHIILGVNGLINILLHIPRRQL